jgi:hypothetical protein
MFFSLLLLELLNRSQGCTAEYGCPHCLLLLLLQVNISLVVDGSEGQRAVQALHKEFFEGPQSCLPRAATNGNGAAAQPAGASRR